MSASLPGRAAAPARILVVGALDVSLLRFRGRLVSDLIARGHELHVAAPSVSPERRAAFEDMGARVHEYPLSRTGLDPFRDLGTVRALSRLMKEHDIELVFPYTLKPVIYASFAARMRGVTAVSLITGLGYAFAQAAAPRARLVRAAVVALLRRALCGNAAVLFQNPDDLALFRAEGLLPRDLPVEVVAGSGVDLEEFPASPTRTDDPDAGVRVVFAARLIREKGIDLYLDAAEALKPEFPDVSFDVLGELQPGSPSAIDGTRLRELVARGIVEWHGRRPDIQRFLSRASVFVLPSWYREGVPRSLLEALATGLAVVTTDSPGCRETVRDGVNGRLVPPRDGAALIHALRDLLSDRERTGSMGRASAVLARERFDVRLVNRAVVTRIEGALTHVLERRTLPCSS